MSGFVNLSWQIQRSHLDFVKINTELFGFLSTGSNQGKSFDQNQISCDGERA
jgi:hypothetical protein